ncbi:MAG: 1-acyl-sn-glycerol-3-phosphate acyltransferase, partial [Cutibacterium granulosum]|nr:1-acyl-sn-glycerol-3-phosphate acyltransferase [Cutibacterium granulosum]
MGAKPTKSRGRYTSTLSAVSREAANLLLLKPLVWRLTDVTVHGVANLDSLDGAYIVVANHSSHLDT